MKEAFDLAVEEIKPLTLSYHSRRGIHTCLVRRIIFPAMEPSLPFVWHVGLAPLLLLPVLSGALVLQTPQI